MKSITQLRNWIYPLPTRFAEEADNIPVASDDGKLNFTDGFPMVYSENPHGVSPTGRYLLRKDFNSFGEMASREALFREAGGIHTFSPNAINNTGGYPEGAMLSAYDGEYLYKVESTERNNKKAFLDDDGAIKPGVIDCLTKYDEEGDAEYRILWRSSGRVFGLEEEKFRLYLDFTRINILPQGGGIISEDSLVLGILIAMVGLKGGGASIDDLTPLSHTTPMSGTIINKGKCGDIVGEIILPWIKEGKLDFKGVPILRCSGGTGNYAMSFFAKAGTSFSGKGTAMDISRDILWVAIPIKAGITTDEEEYQ